MKLAKVRFSSGKESVALVERDKIVPLSLSTGHYETLYDILESSDPSATAQLLVDGDSQRVSLDDVTLLAPIDRQEVWAAGVTYTRSRAARMEESVGAASFYEKVYEAPRPELFFKATPGRVVGPHQAVRIRQDANWSVPEPELALVLNSSLQLVGYTIGNDMSSRDIEGENPLYLPQAKLYDECCALGPCVTLVGGMPTRDRTFIRMSVTRDGKKVFEDKVSITKMARSFEDLIGYLGRDNSFRDGVILLTGTGIVPQDDFTLQAGDVVEIAIDGIGTLVNPVAQG
jgi:2-dehydro-3-deoxy-D-arabinonate dehydratase